MREEEYYAWEYSDDFLTSQANAGDRLLEERIKDHAMLFLQWIRMAPRHADAGDFHLEENMPTREEMQKMATEGEAMLLAQWVRQNLQKEQQK